VLVEKPLTTRFQDAIELCELAEKNHTFISVGYMTRHHENLALLKRLLDSGFLGTIVSFHYEYGFRGGWEPVSGYNLDPQAAGGGVLIVVGSHFVDRMLYLFGRPASFLYADDNHGGVEANCKAEFTFEKPGGRFTGSLFLSKTMRLKNMFILETDRYTCRLVEGQSESLTLHPHNAPELELIAQPREKGPPQGRRSDYALQLEEFATVARRGGQPAVDGWFAAQSVHLLEEMYRNRMPLEEPFQAPWPKRALGVSSRG
jgi:predicted dehydrogenase